MKKIKKILIVGLDQAGKTSILNILNNKFNLMDNIKPTTGIERDEVRILGIPIHNWDLGGQEQFRREYLLDLKIFTQVDSLFFVIDALNERRYEEALHYYSEILNVFKKLDLIPKPKIVLCIHKIDPNIRNNPNTLHLIKKLEEFFSRRSLDYEIATFVTSIYDRRSIVEAFSKVFQEIVLDLKPFKKFLESLALQFKLDGIILFDEKLMILSEFYNNAEMEKNCLNMVYNSVYYLAHTNPELVEENEEKFMANFEFILNIQNKQKRFNFIQLTLKGWKLYLLAVGEERLDTSTLSDIIKSMAQSFEKEELS